MRYFLTVTYLLCTTSAMVLLKYGGNSFKINLIDGFSFKIGWISLLGFIIYIISFLLWQKLLVSFNLSYIVPITTGIAQVLILLASYFVFKEQINFTQLIGILFVVVGVILISLKK